ncbi:glutamine--fructose-6-phosphate transaminase (isomerizing) [Qipengyuania gaetbuli]|uniref:glutamine--fructose-6-phosphate transaminase (isomerizing) n=1 Tax=Qipengyuania gaetbuli TaxID=266952 RepID=UPI001C991F80|nr:glutamine--fructose-6-phosphate transaminase (isomerizing) [Qipengyuania gaetbuli]MBY6016092.1 glutamine--fructose-6-phosphate transaminase (isomerizing) [Qipengyuania gaetbuli]
MCGIVGILGRRDVTERVVEGLSRLEYRGYDSAGVALMDESGQIAIRRSVGKLQNLRSALEKAPLSGLVGIGHTRWATHGAATEFNAHPHSTANVTLVHNGIIENYAELRAELEAEGVVFSSDTDTEVAAQLLERLLGKTDSLEDAFERLLKLIHGSYALAVIYAGRRDVMFAARHGSPLAIGYGELAEDGTSEMFIGSDALALAPFTDRVSYLEDGDWAVVRADRVVIRDAAGDEVVRDVVTVPASIASTEKGPFRHYMLKEIHDQPQTLARLLSSLVDTHEFTLKPFLPDLDFNTIDKVTLVACGTAHYACHVAKYWFEEIAGLSAEIDIASEYRYRRRIHSKRELVIAVSQSGETADTLAAFKDVKGSVAGRLAVVNVPTSSLAREAEYVLDIEAGPEIGVASTKAFTGQMLALLALALKAGSETGALCGEELSTFLRDLVTLPRVISETIALEQKIEMLAHEIAPASDAVFLGRGINYPIALEAALKLKEISYIHAEGYAAGELKHGPIALVDAQLPVVVFDNDGALQEKTISNAEEVKARGARVWHVGKGPAADVVLPSCGALVAPFLHAIVAQLLAYHAALAKGTDVDQPRNLAKSVTVE